jgi:hypothetical protein
MSNTTTSQDRYTLKVAAWTEVATLLRQPRYVDLIRAAGLLDRDLAEIRTQGEAAARFDRIQHEQLAAQLAGNQELFASRWSTAATWSGTASGTTSTASGRRRSATSETRRVSGDGSPPRDHPRTPSS